MGVHHMICDEFRLSLQFSNKLSIDPFTFTIVHSLIHAKSGRYLRGIIGNVDCSILDKDVPWIHGILWSGAPPSTY